MHLRAQLRKEARESQNYFLTYGSNLILIEKSAPSPGNRADEKETREFRLSCLNPPAQPKALSQPTQSSVKLEEKQTSQSDESEKNSCSGSKQESSPIQHAPLICYSQRKR